MNTLFTGKNKIELECTESTNLYVLELLKTHALPEGTVVISREQTAGRGQRGNSWISEPGKNITASFIFYPAFIPAEKQFVLNKFVSLALADTLRTVWAGGEKYDIRIKWPNDIYVNGKKIAGVLIENSLRQHTIAFSVCGIGLNVNQEFFDEEAGNAVSMKNTGRRDYDLITIMEKLCSCLEARYLQLKAGKMALIDEDYLHLLYLKNIPADFIIEGEKRKGVIQGVSETGKLIIRLEDGKRELNMKQIIFD